MRLQDSQTGEFHDTMCTCTTHEEFLDAEYRSLMNELSYDACVEFVEREGYAVEDSSCVEDYEAGYWALGFGHGEYELSGEPEFCDSAPVGCGAS